jgi:hypothetical protein
VEGFTKHIIFFSVLAACTLSFISNTRCILTAWTTLRRSHFLISCIIWITRGLLSFLDHRIGELPKLLRKAVICIGCQSLWFNWRLYWWGIFILDYCWLRRSLTILRDYFRETATRSHFPHAWLKVVLKFFNSYLTHVTLRQSICNCSHSLCPCGGSWLPYYPVPFVWHICQPCSWENLLILSSIYSSLCAHICLIVIFWNHCYNIVIHSRWAFLLILMLWRLNIVTFGGIPRMNRYLMLCLRWYMD